MARRRVVALVVVVAAVAALVVVLARRGGDDGDGRDGSVVVETDPAFRIGTRDEPHRIVYRLTDLSDDDVEESTDEVWVDQPFASRLETSTDGELQSLQIAAVDRVRVGSLDDPLVLARVPGLAVSDVRVAPLLEGDGVDDDLLELREQREVLGRRCQVVRTGTLLGAGPLVPITDEEHADSCIDAEGLLLEELLHRDGTPTLHRIAVEVDLDPSIDADLFDAGEITLPVDEGGGSARPVDPEVGAVGPFWVLPGNEPPAGFRRVGRFGVIPPQPEKLAGPVQDPGVVAGTADVFERGADFVVVYQGGTIGRVEAFAPTPGATAVDGGAVGRGEVLPSALGTELRFPQDGGGFVHVVGTLPAAELQAIARRLTGTEGTGLVYLDR